VHYESTSLLITGEQTGGRFALLETTTKGLQELPLHAHTREDELIYVVRGELTFYRDGTWLEGPAGTCVLLPKGSEHAYRVTSGEARLLIMLMPAGLEGYYQELGQVTETTHYTERLISVSAKYGVRLTGPAPIITASSEEWSPAACEEMAPGGGKVQSYDWHTLNEYPGITKTAMKGGER
jgi:quercetin dioxygenase-like cupin family protein